MSVRFCRVRSTSAPAGVVIVTPAGAPIVITVPMRPRCHPCASSRIPRNEPIPACMPAMKKLATSSARRPRGRVMIARSR